MTLMVPTLIGSSVAQINILVDTAIASMLPLAGSIGLLYYSERLLEFPLGLFGIAISTVILPKLSVAFADLDHADYQKTMKWAMSLAMSGVTLSRFRLKKLIQVSGFKGVGICSFIFSLAWSAWKRAE